MTRLLFDAATAATAGARDRQEDAVMTDLGRGSRSGIAVLSDGMGGAHKGDRAARLLVSEMFARLGGDADPQTLRAALDSANTALRSQVCGRRSRAGTGGTLLSAVVRDDGLRWISVGDSALFLLRAGRLRRLNADHSMGAEIDALVRLGRITADAAARHPHRDCLTSAVTGGQIAHVDCPADAVRLEHGDVVALVSDGVLALGETGLRDTLASGCGAASKADAVIDAVTRLGLPDQDNASAVIPAARSPARVPAAPLHSTGLRAWLQGRLPAGRQTPDPDPLDRPGLH